MVESTCILLLKVFGTVVAGCFALFLIALMAIGLYCIAKDAIEEYGEIDE